MRSAVPIAAWAIALALGLAAGAAPAATSTKAKAATSKSATQAAPAKSTRSTNGKPRRSTAKAKPVAPPLPELTQAQLDVSQLVHIGRAECEFDQSVLIEPDTSRFGAFRVRFNNKNYKMVPEETATGAVRLQDTAAGIIWLQIPVKSMMMNMNVGQRMVDACTQPPQRLAQSDADAQAQARAAAAASVAAQAASSVDGALPAPQVAKPAQNLPLLRN